MNRVPKSGELYRHFKNKLYQIVTVATHSETGEPLVIYQALYGDFKVYARPLEMFLSEVEHEKYPQVTQKYRFEKVEREAMSECEPVQSVAPETESRQEVAPELKSEPQLVVTPELKVEPQLVSEPELKSESQLASEPEKAPAPSRRTWENKPVEEKMTEFFDTEDLETRYNILVSLKGELNDLMINNLAVVLDVVIPDGDVDARYEELKRCIRTKQKYENSRLR